LRVLLIEAEEQAEDRDREQSAADSKEPARGTDKGADDEPDDNLEEVEVDQIVLVRCRGRKPGSVPGRGHRGRFAAQRHVRGTAEDPQQRDSIDERREGPAHQNRRADGHVRCVGWQ